MKTRLHLAVLILVAFGGRLSAQDPVLILEDKPQIQGKTRARPTPAAGDATSTAVAAPTPRPEEVMVAIVNSRVLTRADIQIRVTDQFDRLQAEVQSRVGGVVATIDPSRTAPLAPEEILEEALVTQEQQTALDRVMKIEEESALMAWVEHSLLAEEARRQGVVVEEREFRERLAGAEKESEVTAADVDRVLSHVRMSRADYESSVYDALRIEKMIDRFIALNYDEKYLRDAYEKNPALYYEPAKSLIAHFAITLTGTETRDRTRDLRNVARDLRARLLKNEDPDILFKLPEFDRPEEGILGGVPGWYHFHEGELPPQVAAAAIKLKKGETTDVIIQQSRVDGEVVPTSMHVVKIMDQREPAGLTFESAQPAIRRALLEIGRTRLLQQIRDARTHRVITNLSGIPGRLVPSPEDLMMQEKKANPISLYIPRDNPEPAQAVQ